MKRAVSGILLVIMVVGMLGFAFRIQPVKAENGLVGYWKFDEGSGITAYDSSSHKNNGTICGANWTKGIANGALNFDGVDDYVDCGDASSRGFPLGSSPRTIAAWFKSEGPGDKIVGWGTTNVAGGVFYMQTYGPKLYFWGHYPGTPFPESPHCTTDLELGQWYFGAITYDGTTIKLYLNGVLENSSTGYSVDTQNSDVYVGQAIGTPYADPFTGAIDEVKIYNYARTAEEIWQDYSTQSYESWPMFRHDLLHTGFSTSSAPDSNRTAWNYTTGSGVYSSPAVAEGRIYFGSLDSKLYCLNATSGAQIWNYTTGGGIVSSPVIHAGKVYFGSTDDDIYCLNATDGALAWSFATGDQIGSSAVVSGDRVFLPSFDGLLYSLNASTGQLIWSFDTTFPWYTYSTPAVLNGIVYWEATIREGIYGIPSVLAFDASTGIIVWKSSIGGADSSPLAVDGKLYVAIDRVYCLNATTGTQIWNSSAIEAFESSPAVAYDRIFVGTADGNVYSLDASTGEIVWNYLTGNSIRSSPAVADNKIYVGSDDNRVYCLNASDGSCIWSFLTGNLVFSSPAIACDSVYIGSADGKVYAFTELHDLAISRIETSKSRCLPMPTVGLGEILKIYVTMENKGEWAEHFSVVLYAGNNTIGALEASLEANQTTWLLFDWNTSGVAYGNYTIRAMAGRVSGEVETRNNDLAGDWIIVTLPGDVDGDFGVTILDVVKITSIYALKQGDPGFNPNSDIDDDGLITILDVVICTSHYAQKWP